MNNPNNSSETDTIIHNKTLDSQVMYDLDTLYSALDGILLVSNKPVSIEKLAEVMEITAESVTKLVEERQKFYNNINCGLQIVILDSGVQLATKASISKFIQKLDGQKLVSLSFPALETLSVIAFKQPITKAEIDAIRGVNSDGVISTLLEKKLIFVSGEKQVLGRPRMYSTTQDFLYYFGLQSFEELPHPSVDVPFHLTPEGQKEQSSEEVSESQKDFDESQGFVPIDLESNNNYVTPSQDEQDGQDERE